MPALFSVSCLTTKSSVLSCAPPLSSATSASPLYLAKNLSISGRSVESCLHARACFSVLCRKPVLSRKNSALYRDQHNMGNHRERPLLPYGRCGLFLKPLGLFTRNGMNYKSLIDDIHRQRRMHRHTLQLLIFPFFSSSFFFECALNLLSPQAKD